MKYSRLREVLLFENGREMLAQREEGHELIAEMK